jgi:hypothetical protein
MNRKLLFPLVALAVAAVVYACSSESPAAPDLSVPLFGKKAKPPKVDICHVTGNGSFHLINVSQNAQPAHRGYGDGVPAGAVPGMDGYVFADGCVPVPAADCPCFTDEEISCAPWEAPAGWENTSQFFFDVADPKSVALVKSFDPDCRTDGPCPPHPEAPTEVQAGVTSENSPPGFTCSFTKSVPGQDLVSRFESITESECEVCADLLRAKGTALGW